MPSTEHEQQKHDLETRNLGAEYERKQELHEVELLGEQFRSKHIELNLLQQREDLRPYRTHNTEIFFIPNGSQYVCRLTHFAMQDEDEDEEDSPREMSIEVYGDTPEDACANFDHRWIHPVDDV